MVRNKEQDDLMKQMFKEEVDASAKNIMTALEEVKDKLTTRQDIFEKRIQYQVDSSVKVNQSLKLQEMEAQASSALAQLK